MEQKTIFKKEITEEQIGKMEEYARIHKDFIRIGRNFPDSVFIVIKNNVLTAHWVNSLEEFGVKFAGANFCTEVIQGKKNKVKVIYVFFTPQ